MTTLTSFEERLTALEDEVAQLKQRLTATNGVSIVPWWEQRFGAFAGRAECEEADRLSREYRESLRPKDAEDAA